MANERVLRLREVRVIGADGSQLGVMTSREALAAAKDAGLDLVVVAATAQPPVARIIDFGKFKYEQQKKEKENKRKVQEVKGIKLRPSTAEHDLTTLLRNAEKFLQEGDKVRFVCQFRQRELAHPQIGIQQMEKIAQRLAEIAVIEKPANLDGRQMVMVVTPKPKKEGKKPNAENQDKQDGSEAV